MLIEVPLEAEGDDAKWRQRGVVGMRLPKKSELRRRRWERGRRTKEAETMVEKAEGMMEKAFATFAKSETRKRLSMIRDIRRRFKKG